MFAISAMIRDTALMAINLSFPVIQYGTQYNVVVGRQTKGDPGYQFHVLQFLQVGLKPSSAELRRRC